VNFGNSWAWVILAAILLLTFGLLVWLPHFFMRSLISGSRP
jgi:hypothetical protein